MIRVTQGPSKLSVIGADGVLHEIDGTVTVTAKAPWQMETDGVTLRCGCCGLPWARLVDGSLVVESRHGGAVHINTVSVAALAALAPGNGATNGETWGYSD